jgi:hypothetical protein
MDELPLHDGKPWSTRAIERMLRINRKAVESDVVAIAAQLNLAFCRVVARLAQALQLAGDERRPVAVMRLDVIHHVRHCDAPACQTELAQWLDLELPSAQPAPTRRFVESVPRNWTTAGNRHHTRP